MKTTTILLFLILSLFTSAAQQKPWVKLGIDSIQFTEMYGSENEYETEEYIRNKSSHKLLVAITGAHYMHLLNLSYFFERYKYTASFLIDAYAPSVTIKAEHKFSKSKIVAFAKLNKHAQITGVTITGPADELIKIFVEYWELTPFTAKELKEKKQIVKEFMGDKIAIKWVSKQPVITITKNNSAVIDQFPFKK